MVANQQNLLTKYGDFKRRKLEICPNPSQKNLDIFITLYFLKMWQNFLDFSKKFPWQSCLGLFFIAKWRISATKISPVPGLTTPLMSADSGCALSNNDQIHQFCNTWKAPVTGKFSTLKPTDAQVWGQEPTWGTCHDFMVNEIMNNVSQQVMRGEKATQSKELIYSI